MAEELDLESLQRQLEELRLEHRDLDDVIHRLQMTGGLEQLQLQRLKKRKLKLKDEISRIEDRLIRYSRLNVPRCARLFAESTSRRLIPCISLPKLY